MYGFRIRFRICAGHHKVVGSNPSYAKKPLLGHLTAQTGVD